MGVSQLIYILKMAMYMETSLSRLELRGRSILLEEISNCRLDRNALISDGQRSRSFQMVWNSRGPKCTDLRLPTILR
jgi:hypothetical protein